MTQDLEPQGTDALILEQAFQDDVLVKRLPEWVLRLEYDHIQPFCAALKTSLVCKQQLSRSLQGLSGVGDFVRNTLQEAFDTRFGPGLDVSTLYFRQGYQVPSGEQMFTGRMPIMATEYGQVPLLEAAMGNFVADEAEKQLRANTLVTEAGGRLRQPTAVEFAALCRQLDMGARYQRHLDAVLLSKTDQAAKPNVHSLLLQMQRCTLLVDACKAWAQGVLSKAELQWVLELCHDGQVPPLEGARVVAKQLRILGCDLQQIIVFDVLDEGIVRTTSKRLLAYIPGDPEGPWSAFSDLEQFSRKLLGNRLRDTRYLQFFSRFVRRRDSQRFFTTVVELYKDVAIWATRDLDEHMHAYPQPLFEHLASARISQIKDDAAMILTPVAQLDRAVQRDHDRRIVAEGWALLTLAGLFIPLIGAGLLATMVWDLLGEVFHGIEDWRDGDTAAALDHLSNVTMDLAVAGATVAGLSVVRGAWARSAVVDSLVSAPMEQGGMKLWNQDTTPFRSEAPQTSPDAQGCRHEGGNTWIDMEGHHYPAHQGGDGQWHLMPRAGLMPRLRSNGGGAWRLASDQPSQWTDVYRMFRRLGGVFSELDGARIDAVLSIHGLGADNLRALHMNNQLPDPYLIDTVQRVQLENRVVKLIAQLRAGDPIPNSSLLQHARLLPGTNGLSGADLAEQVHLQRRQLLQRFYDSVQSSDSQAVMTLRRVFPHLHPLAAKALVDGADMSDFTRLVNEDRVSMKLGESARASVARIRRIRVLEALHFDVPQSGDLGRLAVSLLADLPNASLGVRWHLWEGGIGGPVLAESSEGINDVDLIHLNGRFLLLDQHHVAVGEPGDLFEIMASAYSDSQLAETGHAPGGSGLRQWLGDQAKADPKRVERLFAPIHTDGFNPPQRLDDGRIGYRLSGRWFNRIMRRGRPQALSDRVQGVFPQLTPTEIDAWIRDVQASGQRVEALLQRLHEQLSILGRHMEGWVAEVPRGQRQERRNFSNTLIRSWQLSACEEFRQPADPTELWWSLMGGRTNGLPDLPEPILFRYISILSLRQIGISTVPEGFLRAFGNVRVLELPGNAMTRLPLHLQRMPGLQCLDLAYNNITLDPEQSTILSNCEHLSYLNLCSNPLRRSFSVAGMTGLTELRLNDTQIDRLPDGVMECPQLRTLDVRNNNITELPERFFQSRLWVEGQVWLHGNLLSGEQAQALQAALSLPRAPGQPHTSDAFPRMRWLDTIDPANRDNLGSAWAVVESGEGSESFFELLNSLIHTADFRSPAGASNLAARVLSMLQAMEEEAQLRTELFANAQDVTCQDSAALRFNDLEVRVQVWNAERSAAAGNQTAALLRLGRQLWRLDTVDRIAMEDCLARRAAGGDPDEIEVILAYRLALRADLDLPVKITAMRFQYLANVDEARVNRTRQRVLAAESSDQIAHSLIERDFWQRYLRRIHQPRFDELDAPYRTQIEALMADHQRAEAERLQHVARLQNERAQAERETLLDITRNALDVDR